MVLGTKVAPFPYLMWGVVFTACVVISFFFGNVVKTVLVDFEACVAMSSRQVSRQPTQNWANFSGSPFFW